jgi:hypothetical protein
MKQDSIHWNGKCLYKISGIRKYCVKTQQTEQCGWMGNMHITHSGLGLYLGLEYDYPNSAMQFYSVPPGKSQDSIWN